MQSFGIAMTALDEVMRILALLQSAGFPRA
jgi:hypothetical protein